MATSMNPDEKKALHARNLRTGWIFGSIAIAGFLGVVLRYWIFG